MEELTIPNAMIVLLYEMKVNTHKSEVRSSSPCALLVAQGTHSASG